MASPRVRRIRRQKRLEAMQRAEAALHAPAPSAPVPAPEPEPTPAPVVIEMAEEAAAEEAAPIVIEMAPEATEEEPAPEVETAPEEAETLDTDAEIDYNDLTKAELCKELDDRGIEYSRYSNKASLIALLEGA